MRPSPAVPASGLPAPFQAWGPHIEIDLPGARAVFTTRRGGFSSGPYASLNLGRLTGDRARNVKRNRAVLQKALGVELTQTRQVHGREVRRLAAPAQLPSELPEGDGQATSLRGMAPMVLVADCLPLVVAGQGSVAMLHAGWRGLAAGIVAEGVQAVRELGRPGPLVAAIGPGAGPCCYEVSDEVRAAFPAGDGRRGANLDLRAIARRQLKDAGVDEVHDVELCTICGDPALFFSHRRDRGVTGRQAGVAWLS